MGIKENFTQAVKELTGIGKEKGGATAVNIDSVEGLKKAVGSVGESAGSRAREITLDAPDWSVPDWDGSESSTVRPIPRQNQNSEQQQPTPTSDSTPAAEAFLSGGSVPISLFGQQAAPEQQTAYRQQPQQRQNPQAQVQDFNQQNQQSQFYQQSAPPVQPVQPVQNSGYYGGQQQQYRQPFPAVPVGIPQQRAAGTHDDGELTIISRNTTIDGDIRSFADMSIDGDVKGDVETTKNIDLNGKIVGNISCNNAMMHTSQIQGNIRMKGNISMKRDTLLIGDLMATYAEVNGKVKGNLDVVGKADLKGDAVVFGDISASTITVEDGAIIQGYVSTTFLNKEESKNLFPDTVVISNEAGNTA